MDNLVTPLPTCRWLSWSCATPRTPWCWVWGSSTTSSCSIHTGEASIGTVADKVLYWLVANLKGGLQTYLYYTGCSKKKGDFRVCCILLTHQYEIWAVWGKFRKFAKSFLKMAKNSQKWPKNDQKWPKNDQKSPKNGLRPLGHQYWPFMCWFGMKKIGLKVAAFWSTKKIVNFLLSVNRSNFGLLWNFFFQN